MKTDSTKKLAPSIKAGGSGNYGPILMPIKAALSDANALSLANWVLAGAK